MLSPAALLTTGNVVLQSIVPAEFAFKIPASVIAPVPVPAGKVAVAVTVAPLEEKEAKVTRPASVPKTESATAGVAVPVPIAICDITLVPEPTMRAAIYCLPAVTTKFGTLITSLILPSAFFVNDG